MSIILNIDTALETAIMSIARDGKVLGEVVNTTQKDHGSFLQSAIQSIAKNSGISLTELDAIAIVAGPGSYTGLRVGMASAKGLCYALNKPLIAIVTLEIMAYQAIKEYGSNINNMDTLFCPMIDARRMEVFTAIYDSNHTIVAPPCATVVNDSFFVKEMLKRRILFFGNGSFKWKTICYNKNAYFFLINSNSLYISELSFKKFNNTDFANIAYVEPLYIKEFYTTTL